MTGLLIIVLIAFGAGMYTAYTEHIRERDKYFATYETGWIDRCMWRLVGAFKILFCLAVLGGILRLYFMIG